MYPQITKIKTAEEYNTVIQAARANNDGIDFPSHVLRRDNEIVGACSLAVVPMVLAWHHSEKISVRDSLHMKLIYDAMMDTKGHEKFIIACNKHSPYNQHMQKLGYKPIWTTDLFQGGTGV